MCPSPNLFGLALWWVQQQSLIFAISHGDLNHYVAMYFLMAMLNVSLEFALQAIAVNGLWFGCVGIAAAWDGAAINMTGFGRNVIEAVVASELSSKRLDVVQLVLGQIVASGMHC